MSITEQDSATLSLAQLVASSPAARGELERLTQAEADALRWDWLFWGRPQQLPPAGDWRTWLILAGRGFGKTRAGAEWVRALVESGRYRRIALVGATAADVRDVMIGTVGASGLLHVCPPWNRPEWQPSKRRLVWPCGAMAIAYSADEPERLRGPQHDAAWCDELGAWRYPEAWDQLQFGLRLGDPSRVCVTTTPRPTRLIRDLVAATDTVVTRGSTFDNRSNLDPGTLAKLRERYEGTRLGRQELYAEILDDNPGALWKRTWLDEHRLSEPPEMRRLVVGVDPAVTASAESDETGIVLAGLGYDGRMYVLADESGRYSPAEWAGRVIALCQAHGCDHVVAEVNQGGDLVLQTIRSRTRSIRVTGVRAKVGKRLRAQPVAGLYEQGAVRHAGRGLEKLEDQLCDWSPDIDTDSPDRLDALVYALSELAGLHRDTQPRRDLSGLRF